ncbi:MAG: YdeI/OmpD-associated family protein [Chitinophagaceae bacterium]|nr:YdeI/OmpD-associated family protein [Chitinophagaceae bacterium]
MSNLSLFEKLQLVDENSMLIQGLPSSIEKQFAKLSYAKNVTPLVKKRKVDFALVFAVNQNQLVNIMKDVLPALHDESKLWIAYPKVTSKIVSDLNRESSWDFFTQKEYEGVSLIDLDHMWSAIRFKKNGTTSAIIPSETKVQKEEKAGIKSVEFDRKLTVIPSYLEKAFTKHQQAKEIFSSLPESHQNEYVVWIEGAKKDETKQRRLDSVIEKLMASQ